MRALLITFTALMSLGAGCLRATSTEDRWPCEKDPDCPSGKECRPDRAYARVDECWREGNCHCYEKGHCQAQPEPGLERALGCPFGDICVNEKCVAVACLQDIDCERAAYGAQCIDGMCVSGCSESSYDLCAEDSLTCIDAPNGKASVCYPRCANDANCPIGYLCDTQFGSCKLNCSDKDKCPGSLSCVVVGQRRACE